MVRPRPKSRTKSLVLLNPKFSRKKWLPDYSIYLEFFTDDGEPSGIASGILVAQEGKVYLYSCWHAFSGFEVESDRGPKYPGSVKRRSIVRINKPRSTLVGPENGPKYRRIGGTTKVDLKLLDLSNFDHPIPLWEQQRPTKPHPDLSLLGVPKPQKHDIVRIEVPEHDLNLHSDMEIIWPDTIFRGSIEIGSEVAISGYPNGVGAKNSYTQAPVPTIMNMRVSSINNGGSASILLDKMGKNAMSGGAACMEIDGSYMLFGLYSGIVYRNGGRGNSLGVCVYENGLFDSSRYLPARLILEEDCSLEC